MSAARLLIAGLAIAASIVGAVTHPDEAHAASVSISSVSSKKASDYIQYEVVRSYTKRHAAKVKYTNPTIYNASIELWSLKTNKKVKSVGLPANSSVVVKIHMSGVYQVFKLIIDGQTVPNGGGPANLMR